MERGDPAWKGPLKTNADEDKLSKKTKQQRLTKRMQPIRNMMQMTSGIKSQGRLGAMQLTAKHRSQFWFWGFWEIDNLFSAPLRALLHMTVSSCIMAWPVLLLSMLHRNLD